MFENLHKSYNYILTVTSNTVVVRCGSSISVSPCDEMASIHWLTKSPTLYYTPREDVASLYYSPDAREGAGGGRDYKPLHPMEVYSGQK